MCATQGRRLPEAGPLLGSTPPDSITTPDAVYAKSRSA